MATNPLTPVLRHVRKVAGTLPQEPATDAALLEQFTSADDPAAFEALVHRHGGLVWRVCRRVLGCVQDAEDVWQGTFFCLARQAGSIRKPAALASWLHGVAFRLASKARLAGQRRRAREQAAASPEATDPAHESAWRELGCLIEEELHRLAEKYRLPLLLTYWRGLSNEEAARALGWRPGTLKARLARARALLHRRLLARGVTLPVGAVLMLLSPTAGAEAALPALAASAVRAAVALAAGECCRLSVQAGPLLEGVAPALGGAKLKFAVLLVVLLGAATLGLSAFPAPGPLEQPAEVDKAPDKVEAADVAKRKEAATDRHGDPLPPAAHARLGTLRQRAPGAHLAVTADGTELIAVSVDRTVRRFDAQTGALRSAARLPGDAWYGSWLSPRGTLILAAPQSAPGNDYLELWDTARGERLGTLPLGNAFVSGAAFSADERMAAVADSTPNQAVHRVQVWDLQTRQARVLWSLKQLIQRRYFDPVVALSPDGKRLAACHLDLALRCWDVASGKLLWEAPKRNWSPFVYFHPDGKSVVTATRIGLPGLCFWDAATGRPLEPTNLPKDAVYPVGVSPDGRLWAFETGFGDMVLWEPAAARVAARIPRPPSRQDNVHHTLNRLPTDVVFTPDSKGLIRRQGVIQRWDLTTGKVAYADTQAWGHTEAVTRLLFSPSGNVLASTATDGTVRLWDVAGARALHTFQKGISDHLAFTPDGRHVLALPFGVGKAALWRREVATGREGPGFELPDGAEFTRSSTDRGLWVTADGRRVLMQTRKNGGRADESLLTVWDTAAGKCLANRQVPWPADSLLTPDGESVLAFDRVSRSVGLLAVATGEARVRFQWDGGAPAPGRRLWGCELALAQDGRVMAARTAFVNRGAGKVEYDAVRLGDMATGRQLATLPVAGPAVFTFSADSRFFVLAGAEGITLWETASCRRAGRIASGERGELGANGLQATALALSLDGRILATGHADSTILLWDASLLGDGNRSRRLTAAEAEAHWDELAGADAARAYGAVWRLAANPAQALPLLRERLRPILPAPAGVISKLLRELDSPQFPARQASERELRTLGERAAPGLRQALTAGASLETRRRIEGVLAALLPAGPLEGDALRGVRAVQVLERLGTLGAQRILKELSGGATEARLTREARAALERLARHGAAASP